MRIAFRSLRYSLSPMQQAVKSEKAHVERRLNLSEILDGLVEDKVVSVEAAEELRKERRYYKGTLHPLVIVADQKWKQAGAQTKLLSLEVLTEWLGKRGGLGYLHIRPLKNRFSGGPRGVWA